jgi:hypothetical protein
VKVVNLLLAALVALLTLQLFLRDGHLISGLIQRSLSGVIASTTAPASDPAPSKPSPPPSTPVVRESALFQRLIANGENRDEAWRAYLHYLQTSPQWEVHARVRRHMPDGHLVLIGFYTDVATHGAATTQTFTLFGVPNADAIADGEIIDCFSVWADPMTMPDGSMLREFIFAPNAGRIPPQFEAGIYPK